MCRFPDIELNQGVKKGQPIGIVYKEEVHEIGALVHLHLVLGNRMIQLPGRADPGIIYPQLRNNMGVPQGSLQFRVASVIGNPSDIKIANFRELRQFS